MVRLRKIWSIFDTPPSPSIIHQPSHQEEKHRPYAVTISRWGIDDKVTGHCVLADAPRVRSSQDWWVLVADHVHCQPQPTDVGGEGIIIRFNQQLKKATGEKNIKDLLLTCICLVTYSTPSLILCSTIPSLMLCNYHYNAGSSLQKIKCKLRQIV